MLNFAWAESIRSQSVLLVDGCEFVTLRLGKEVCMRDVLIPSVFVSLFRGPKL